MRWGAFAAAVLVAVLAVPAVADHQPMPHEWYDNADSYDLIGNYNYMTARTVGTDTWEVWICDPVGPSSFSSLNRFVGYTPRMVVDWLTERSTIGAYFNWLSDGKYKLGFRIGGSVTPDLSKLAFADYANIWDRGEACVEAVKEAAEGSRADGALVVDTTHAFHSIIGTAWMGATYCEAGECEPFPHPDSGRYAFVGAGVWADLYIHEIGHALGWPHSFFYNPDVEDQDEYNNPMDVMSGSIGWVGTIAINRYAAGWINPDDVYVWELGDKSKTLWLDTVGVTGGYQMLVLRDAYSTWYYTFGARVQGRFDSHLPKEGVEWYTVDESVDTGCDWDGWDWCPGTGRAVHAWGEPNSTDHVLSVDESVSLSLWNGQDWVDVEVSVMQQDEGSYRVRISG
ncbi:MAG: hypothetical protein OXH83_11075 [Bryobacterales bacterium]|nr:hypothetical protein [Bryobacterales bacterium]